MKYIAVHSIQRDRVRCAPGDVLELTPAEAERLLARGAIREPITEGVAERASSRSAGAGNGLLEEKFPTMNAKDSIAAVEAVVSPDCLDALEALENQREKGARKTVLDAIDARRLALLEDEDKDDDGEGAE